MIGCLRVLLMKPTLILINPWIYDFAAYDLWSKPLGLLYLAGYLSRCGFHVRLIDCLDVHHPEMKGSPSLAKPVRRLYGTGKFWRELVPKPSALQHIPRSYSRYGITRQLFIKELKKITKPAAILVTSLMTYWYPGVKDVITLAKEIHPGVPVILGGIYARLCREHALRISGADYVVSGGGLHNLESVLNVMHQMDIPVGENPAVESVLPYPAFHMLHKIDYIVLLTSTGCPYRCQYCASHFLNPLFSRREPTHIIQEIQYWNRSYGVQDFAFYDDALLVDSHIHIAVILEGLLRRNLGLRFHTPNALHVRGISHEIASLLHQAGFRTIRLGLETSDMKQHEELDGKVSEGEFERAVHNLKRAGFTKEEIGTYILIGLPGQSVDSVEETIKLVGMKGATPYLAEYSPLPHTPMWGKACSCSDYDIASEPLFHNNSLLPCWDESQREKVLELKRLVKQIRQN